MKTVNFCRFFIIILFILILTECRKPSDNEPLLNGMTEICLLLEECNKCSNNTQQLKKLLHHKMLHSNGIVSLPENASFNITSFKDLTSDLFYSVENNQFICLRNFYVTFIRKDMYLSLDGIRWAAIYSNPLLNKGKKYFESNYRLEPDYIDEEHLLNVKYTISVRLFDEQNIPYTNAKFNRPILTLNNTIGQILWSQTDKDVNTILSENILLIPANTIFKAQGDISGNVVTCQADNNILIKMQKSVYLYSDILPAMSFDNHNWNINPFNVKIHTNIKISTFDENTLVYEFHNSGEIE